MNTISFNSQVPGYDAVARFYLTPIGKFLPWKYVAKERLDSILKECYRYGNPTTRKMIEEYYEVQMPAI
jgi:hypothetical protein